VSADGNINTEIPVIISNIDTPMPQNESMPSRKSMVAKVSQ
jgi:hypothetical protein